MKENLPLCVETAHNYGFHKVRNMFTSDPLFNSKDRKVRNIEVDWSEIPYDFEMEKLHKLFFMVPTMKHNYNGESEITVL